MSNEVVLTKIEMNAFLKSEAISFAYWIAKFGYVEYDEAGKWISLENTGTTVYTTSQLYDLWKNH